MGKRKSFFNSTLAGVLAVILGIGAIITGAVGLFALIFGLHVAVVTAIFWIANHVLAKVVTVKLLTLKQDFFLAMFVVLIKSVFSSAKHVTVNQNA